MSRRPATYRPGLRQRALLAAARYRYRRRQRKWPPGLRDALARAEQAATERIFFGRDDPQ